MSSVKRGGFAVGGEEPAAKALDIAGFAPRTRAARPEDKAADREATAIAAKAGFSSRSGGKIDGRTLRRTGRTAQMNIKVEPELKARILERAAQEEVAVGELMERMLDAYEATGGGGGRGAG